MAPHRRIPEEGSLPAVQKEEENNRSTWTLLAAGYAASYLIIRGGSLTF